MSQSRAPAHASNLALTFGALGIVFGDIGTSPLYTLQVGIAPEPGVHPAPADVLGVLSLIVWAITLVVSVKYVAFVMRADNQGEGGILALLALLPRPPAPTSRPGEPGRAKQLARLPFIVGMVIAGAALLYGDGIITPAISVLSAIEGLTVAAPAFKPWVVPLTCVILVALFLVQRKGTGALGVVFGPIMVVWFATIGALGAVAIARNPGVLRALSPTYGASYFLHHGLAGVPILGVVVLAVTGGEALYADMGHFGPVPIRRAWWFAVFPALVLSYLGQGALVLAHPTDDAILANPFFTLTPGPAWAVALVVLATLATVIASQALISGVFSLTQQAVSLGIFPRVTIHHTAAEAEGQIYVPELNWLLAAACTALVLAFRESSRLANAYGLAVSGTMLVTTVAFYEVARRTWGWSVGRALPLLLLFLSFDVPFVVANSMKFVDGGFVPVVVGALFFAVMVVWRRGRILLGEHMEARTMPLAKFHEVLHGADVSRPPGGAIFLTTQTQDVPAIVVENVRRLRALQQNLMLLTILIEHVPYVEEGKRATAEDLGDGLYRVLLRYGYMEKLNVPAALAPIVQEHALPFDLTDATYLLGRETIIGGPGGAMSPSVENFFGFLQRNAKSVSAYLQLPYEHVVEIGIQVNL